MWIALVLAACEPPLQLESSSPAFQSTAGKSGPLVQVVLGAMDRSGANAGGVYEQHLSRLRAEPDAFAAVAQALSRQTKGYARWKLVLLLGELRDPRAVGVLRDIASQPQAPRRQAAARSSRMEQTGSTQAAEDAMLRRRAVWGLEKLAATATSPALVALRGLLSAPDHEVRYESAFALFRLKKLSAADKAVMLSQGLSDKIRVRSTNPILIRTRPRADTMLKIEQNLKAAATRALASPLPLPPGPGVQP